MKPNLTPATVGLAGAILALLAPAAALAAAPTIAGQLPNCSPNCAPTLVPAPSDMANLKAQVATLQAQVAALQTAMNKVDEQLFQQPFPPPAGHSAASGKTGPNPWTSP